MSQRQRGSALVGAVTIAVVAGIALGVALTLNASYNKSAYVKADSEAALLLAEAGINDELNAISTKFLTGEYGWSSKPLQSKGEPYPGRKGEVEDSDGAYWVYTSSDPEGKTPWAGTSQFYIHCTAVVNGARRKVRIGGPRQPFQSPFSMFCVFGLDDSSTSNQPNIALAGNNTVVDIQGGVGTNGRVQGGAGKLRFTAGYNYNYLQYESTPHEQITGSSVYQRAERLVLPTVTEVIKQTVPATAELTDAEAWAYIKTNRAQLTNVRQWKAALPGGAELSPTNVQSANFGSGAGALSLNNSSSKSTAGRWTLINLAPGSTSKRTLIFQPGDYYFERISLVDNPHTELIIDNAGLTIPGGNPDRAPVRFFVAGTSQMDQIEVQIKQTDPADPAALRIYYSKPGSVFHVRRPNSWANGKAFDTTCGVYAVTGGVSKPTRVSIVGGNGDSDWISITGGFIADRIEFNGRCRVIYPGEMMVRANDPRSGVGYANGYSDE